MVGSAHADKGAWTFDATAVEAFVEFDGGGGRIAAQCGSQLSVRTSQYLGKGNRPIRELFLAVDQKALPAMFWRYEANEARTLAQNGPLVEQSVQALVAGDQLQVTVKARGAQRHYRASLRGAGEAISQLRSKCAAR